MILACSYTNQNDPHHASGYRPLHSKETALLRVSNDQLMELDITKAAILIILDISAAFYTINHHLLFMRLYDIAISSKALEWFQSYLEDRYQPIGIKGITSQSTCWALCYSRNTQYQ